MSRPNAIAVLDGVLIDHDNSPTDRESFEASREALRALIETCQRIERYALPSHWKASADLRNALIECGVDL